MTYDELRAQIKNLSPADLAALGVIEPARTKANGILTYICPNCSNGSGKSGDGIAFEYKDGAWLAKCFKCGAGFDNIKLLALHYRIENHGAGHFEILKRAATDFGIATDFDFKDFNSYHNLSPLQIRAKIPSPPVKDAETLAQESKLIELLRKDIAYARRNLKDFLDRQGGKWRDLNFETLSFFSCGYDEFWVNPYARLKNVRHATPTPRVIIPAGNHYLARLTAPLEKYKNAPDFEYIKDKPHFGSKSTFGIKTLTAATEIIVATEGEIDAMQLWQAYHAKEQELDFLRFTCKVFETADVSLVTDKETIPVSKATLAKKAFIATCGAAETFWINEVDAKCKALKCRPLFIIMFDDDDTGRKNAPKCKAELDRRGYPVAVKFLKKKG